MKRKLLFAGNTLAILATLVLFGYAVRVVSAEPCMGVADILDFFRVTQPAGLEHLSPLEAPGYYTRCEFRTTATDFWSAPSSAALLAIFAKVLRPLGPAEEGFFALRQMGLLFVGLAALFTLGGLVARLRPWLALLLVYVVVDPGYLFFWNSFYADGALILAVFGIVIWLDRVGHFPAILSSRRAFLAAVALLGFLMLLGGGSKMLFVLLPGCLLLSLLPGMIGLYRSSPRRVLLVVLMTITIQALVFWNFFFGPGPRFIEFNNFHAVYGGILRVASEPDQVFDRLGVPAEFRDIPREDAWTAGIALEHPVHQHLKNLSRLELLWLYLKDPPALQQTLKNISSDLLLVASHPRGTYPRLETDSHPVKRIYGESWQFSNVTRIFYGQWPPAIALILLLPTAWLAASFARGRWSGTSTALLFLLLWFFSQCALAVLGEGFINLHQHLLGARLALDFLVVVFLVDLGEATLSAVLGHRLASASRIIPS